MFSVVGDLVMKPKVTDVMAVDFAANTLSVTAIVVAKRIGDGTVSGEIARTNADAKTKWLVPVKNMLYNILFYVISLPS